MKITSLFNYIKNTRKNGPISQLSWVTGTKTSAYIDIVAYLSLVSIERFGHPTRMRPSKK